MKTTFKILSIILFIAGIAFGGWSFVSLNTFFKAQGGKIGNSLVEDDKMDLALELLKEAKEKGVNIILP